MPAAATYLRVYYQLMDRCSQRNWTKQTAPYYVERHHIIPRALGGDDVFTNTVYLTAREHYVAHHLLHRAYPKNTSLLFAFQMMHSSAGTQPRYTPAREYAYLRSQVSRVMSRLHTGKTLSEEHKRQISQAHKGRPRSDQHLTRLREACKNIPPRTHEHTRRNAQSRTMVYTVSNPEGQEVAHVFGQIGIERYFGLGRSTIQGWIGQGPIQPSYKRACKLGPWANYCIHKAGMRCEVGP